MDKPSEKKSNGSAFWIGAIYDYRNSAVTMSVKRIQIDNKNLVSKSRLLSFVNQF